MILVVEDEIMIQEIVGDYLSQAGINVEIVASGEAAVKLFESDRGAYQALVTDIHLSGPLTGWDVAKRARQVNPNLPVIYMTSDASGEWPAHGVPHSIILNKPFARAQIVAALVDLLKQSPPLAPRE